MIFFCTIAILTKTTNTMKLKNSFLIAAGIFFFAVAFINFAKAGDDGGGRILTVPCRVSLMQQLYMTHYVPPTFGQSMMPIRGL